VVRGLPSDWGMCFRIVTLGNPIWALTCWKDTIAVGLQSGDIITIDGITGSQIAVFSGHPHWVRSLAFSPDGRSLVSGSYDKTVKLWDIQTGGVVKTFHGHTNWVVSVSVSADCSIIASGSWDKTINLWNIQTGECHHVIEQQDWVYHVRFSPSDPQYLISVSGDKVWHWDINDHKSNPAHNGHHIAFSLDGTQFVSCQGGDIVVQSTDSGAIVTKFHVTHNRTSRCCFSPDGRLIAVAADRTVYVLDITSSNPHLIKTFTGDTWTITSLTFSSPSSLISSSDDKSVKFWQIDTLPTDPVVADPESTSLALGPVKSVTLQAKDGIAISSNSDGMVRTWDISTGLCKGSIQTPAKDPKWSNVQLVNNRLIIVWYADKIYTLDVEKGELLQTVDVTLDNTDGVDDVRISGDGSKVFCLRWRIIQAWSILTGEVVGELCLQLSQPRRFLTVDGSRVWVHSPLSEPLGWDFGIPDSLPVQLSGTPLLHHNGTKQWDIGRSRIKDRITGKVVFQLAGKFANPVVSQWDGRHLVAGYQSGEVLILDFNPMFL